jgi:hypothetical protein
MVSSVMLPCHYKMAWWSVKIIHHGITVLLPTRHRLPSHLPTLDFTMVEVLLQLRVDVHALDYGASLGCLHRHFPLVLHPVLSPGSSPHAHRYFFNFFLL